MASDDDVIVVGETFSNKRARKETENLVGAEPSVDGTGEFALDSLQCPICIDLVYDPCVGEAYVLGTGETGTRV
jgi:hypothetical protein